MNTYKVTLNNGETVEVKGYCYSVDDGHLYFEDEENNEIARFSSWSHVVQTEKAEQG